MGTPKDSLQFPSFRSSCLVLNTDIVITKDLLDYCLGFLSSNTNPFILLTPLTSQVSPMDKVSRLTWELMTQLVPLSMKAPTVVGTMTINMAHNVVIELVVKSVKNINDEPNLKSQPDKMSRIVRALMESGLCKDRVDTILLLSQTGSFNKLAQGASDVP